jgi:hypothetical protein
LNPRFELPTKLSNKLMNTTMTKHHASPKFEACPALQQAIERFNEAGISLLLTAAKYKRIDPLAAFLIGVSDETLDEYSHLSKADLISASTLGAPLFVPRFSDPATLRAMLTTGFSKASVLAALTRTLPLPPVAARQKS